MQESRCFLPSRHQSSFTIITELRKLVRTGFAFSAGIAFPAAATLQMLGSRCELLQK